MPKGKTKQLRDFGWFLTTPHPQKEAPQLERAGAGRVLPGQLPGWVFQAFPGPETKRVLGFSRTLRLSTQRDEHLEGLVFGPGCADALCAKETFCALHRPMRGDTGTKMPGLKCMWLEPARSPP